MKGLSLKIIFFKSAPTLAQKLILEESFKGNDNHFSKPQLRLEG